MRNGRRVVDGEVEAPCLENRRFTLVLMILPLLVVMLIALIVYVRNFFFTTAPVSKAKDNVIESAGLSDDNKLELAARN
ncbi:MAG TPA: hypothetical protein VD927_14330 [Chryseosolibacter sp.]|nr:hypothetical protein [Chryseosolibacter sp.]